MFYFSLLSSMFYSVTFTISAFKETIRIEINNVNDDIFLFKNENRGDPVVQNRLLKRS